MGAVLIVDDNPVDRARIGAHLVGAGLQVHEAEFGLAAIHRARAVHPHLVLIGVGGPDPDGPSVCRALRADPIGAGLQVLMLTLRDDDASALAGLEAGADDCVARDAAVEVLLARVRRLVRYRQLATVAALNEGFAQVGRLLAGIVHEIRGPLSVVRGHAELLKMGLGEMHDAQVWVEPILRNCQLLQARLEHLMATVRGGPPILQALDLPPLVREAAELFRKGVDPRSGKVEVEADFPEKPPPALGDAGRLIQVLLNLLGNAYEAIVSSRRGGRIRLRIPPPDRDDGRWVKLEVVDDGPGIPEPLLGRIFEPFFTTKDGGSGYGLYLAAELIREQGGRLTVCNSADGGACFTIWLPAAFPPSPRH
jgi:signal transduction histidine kinase